MRIHLENAARYQQVSFVERGLEEWCRIDCSIDNIHAIVDKIVALSTGVNILDVMRGDIRTIYLPKQTLVKNL